MQDASHAVEGDLARQEDSECSTHEDEEASAQQEQGACLGGGRGIFGGVVIIIACNVLSLISSIREWVSEMRR